MGEVQYPEYFKCKATPNTLFHNYPNKPKMFSLDESNVGELFPGGMQELLDACIDSRFWEDRRIRMEQLKNVEVGHEVEVKVDFDKTCQWAKATVVARTKGKITKV